MIANRSRSARIGCVALWLLLFAPVAAELYLTVSARMAAGDVETQRAGNVFMAARGVEEAWDESLWQPSGAYESYRPNAELEVDIEGVRHHVKINSHGYRSAEFSVPKPAGRLRILCIGGSTTVQGRTNELTYPAVLERLLEERFPGVDLEVVNLGVSGTQSARWLDGELFGFEPDIVVQYNAINEIAWNHLVQYAETHPWRARFTRSRLFQKLFPLDATALDEYYAVTIGNFVTLSRACRERGVDYMAGTFAAPSASAAPRDFLRLLDADISAAWGQPMHLRYYAPFEGLIRRHNELLTRTAAETGLDRVGVDERMSDPSLFIDPCHMTPEGIEDLALAFFPAVARAVEARLTEAGR